jgi:hypothetical protein
MLGAASVFKLTGGAARNPDDETRRLLVVFLKSPTGAYEVLESKAGVVRMMFEMYTQQRLSINAIARCLNGRGIPTRTGKSRWERSTV